MRLDTHGQTTHSGYSTIRPLHRVIPESYNSVEGHYFAMASDICRMATGFYVDRIRMLAAAPGDWNRHADLACGVLGMPLVLVPLALALAHFVLEDRFNRNLLVDLVGIPFRLVVVGEGPMTRELQELCPDAAFTGRLSHDQVAIAMASADVFVFPSETDAAGNVVLEAQASGLPVIVSSAGGPQEYMRHGETGFVCAPRDAHGVAERLADLLPHAGCRSEMGAAARRYTEGWSWPASLQPVYDLYRSALHAPAASGAVSSGLSRPTGVSPAA